MTLEWSADTTVGARKTREAHHGCRTGRQVPTCGGAFRCAKCGKLVGWCLGASDDCPDWCDACTNAWHDKTHA